MVEYLEKLLSGKITKLAIIAPPRHGKSLLGSVMLPAFVLGRDPRENLITASYGSELSEGFGRRVRNILSDPVFQRIFPECRISPDSSAVYRLATTAGGECSWIGRGGAATGKGASLLILDDLVKDQAEAQSEAICRSIIDWIRSVAFTRLSPGGRVLAIATRWSERDPILLIKYANWLKQKAKLANLAEWGMVIFTFILAATTAAYTVYAKRQWQVIGGQLYVTGEANLLERMTQRAYVDFPQQIAIRTTVENGKVTSWIPEITVVNDGNTGTYNTFEVVSVFTSGTEMPKDFNYPDVGRPQYSDLGPHETEVFEAQPIGIAAVQSINHGGHIYIYGLVVYRDVFQFYGGLQASAGFERRHLREFCYELRLDSLRGDVTSPEYKPPQSMNLYGRHNCTDGDCDDESKIIARYQ